jgi:DNA mismatch repair protein MutH
VSEINYDKTSVESIYEYAALLTGKSLSEVVELPENVANQHNRGDLGLLVEKYYFQHVPQSNSGPDFAEAGVELKTTGVRKKSDGQYVAKERLVLTMINYESIVNETWEESSFYYKCQLMLLMFYLYSQDVSVENRKFVLNPIICDLKKMDLSVIKDDWLVIQRKVKEGKAHELSEGDTFVLAACRKGSGGATEQLRSQPFSKIKAKSRAFSFKPGFITKLISGNFEEEGGIFDTKNVNMDTATKERFAAYIGKSIDQIATEVGFVKGGNRYKSYLRDLAVKILANGGSSIPELEKAEIELKTIRLNKNGRTRESMSFPGFKFDEIINQEWEDSKFFERIERKFLFIIFQEDEFGVERLLKISYWNMPYKDRLEAERVWLETKRRVAIDARNLPKKSESHVAHVRPKARDSQDRILTPQGDLSVKQCFWLNSSYISEVVTKLS